MRLIILTSLFLISSSSIFAQKMTKEQVLVDLNFLQENILRYNPTLLEYTPDFQEKSTQLIQTVTEDLSIFDYFGLVSQICALSNEGHYALGNWQDTVHQDLQNGQAKFFPLTVKIIGQQIFVWGDFSKTGSFQKGDEILSINGFSNTQLIERFFSCLPSDGHIKSYLEHKTSNEFPWLYYLYLERPSHFDIEYQSYSTKERKSLRIEAVNKTERLEQYKLRYANQVPTKTVEQENSNDFYTFEQHDNYSYLNLKSFNRALIKKYSLKSKSFYASIFKQLAQRNSSVLIIDLRNNTGGRNEFADDILPYIYTTKVTTPYLKKTISWEGKEKTYKCSSNSKKAFAGQILVLVNGATFSAGSTLARYLKEYGGATIVGEETGTRYEGFAAGSKSYIDLPTSKIRIGIPRYHIQFPTSTLQKTKNQGLLPDYELSPTIRDLIEKKDVVLEKALSLIKK